MMGRYIVLILFAILFEGVFGDEVKSVMEGDRVTLNTDVTKGPNDTMLWYFEDTRIALINGHPSASCLYDGVGGRFRDRLEVDYKTGSLTITDIRSEHAGRYEAELDKADSSGTSTMLTKNRKCDSTKIITKRSNIGETIKTISLTVSVVPGSGLSPAAVAGIVVGVLLGAVAVVVGVMIYRRSIFRNDMKKKKQIPEQVSNDETQSDKSLMA
uniref:Immunoglobulin subtype domain-containing protein n=1 Tax=Cyprinus carpio TaxID=7962 RepID=A0A8C1LNQ2_CYPCA